MVTSMSTDGWLPPHLRIIQSQSQSVSKTNSVSPAELVSTHLRAFDPFQNLQPGLGDGGVSLTGNSDNIPRIPTIPIAGYQSTTPQEEQDTPPHPCSIIEQKQQPRTQSVTPQQWKASLNAHLEKYRSGYVTKVPPENYSPKAPPENSPLNHIAPHLRALSSISASISDVQAAPLATSSSARQGNTVQPSTVSDSTRSWAVTSLAGSHEIIPAPKSYDSHITTSAKGQSPSASNSTEFHDTYLEASSTELDLLPAYLEVLQPIPTQAPSTLTRAHLAAFDRLTETTNFSIAAASSETSTQMTRKPKIDKGKGREVQLPLPAPTPALPPARIRTGDAATWTKKADMPELMKMSKDYPCPYEDCRLGFDNLKSLRRHKVDKHDYCRKCNKDFKDFQDHLDHKIESSEHITCPVCGEDFRSNGGRDSHIRTMHPNPQDLSCPGCGAKFVRAGSLIDHIEKNKCMRISVDQFERYRASHAIKHAHLNSLDFDEDGDTLFAVEPETESVGGVDLVTENGEDEDELAGLTNKTDTVEIQEEHNSSSKTTMASVVAARAELSGSASIRHTSRPLDMEEFPALGGSTVRKTAGALTSTQAGPWVKIPAWSTPGSTSHKVIVETAKQNLGKAKQNVQSGTTRYSHPVLTDMTTGSVPTQSGLTFSNGEPVEAIDPTSSRYNPDAFKTILDTWKCPYPRCGKSFPTRQAFTGHLSSQAHKGVDHRCPECLRIYQDATALTQHMEASSSRCRIKNSKDFEQIMGMVSGGIIRIDGQHVDGTIRYDAGEPEW
ncbi:hypothetical protein MMC11_006521 [Xylographa trunciseda]|nr:hypothetical protein [Xylographa trunciseda]